MQSVKVLFIKEDELERETYFKNKEMQIADVIICNGKVIKCKFFDTPVSAKKWLKKYGKFYS